MHYKSIALFSTQIITLNSWLPFLMLHCRAAFSSNHCVLWSRNFPSIFRRMLIYICVFCASWTANNCVLIWNTNEWAMPLADDTAVRLRNSNKTLLQTQQKQAAADQRVKWLLVSLFFWESDGARSAAIFLSCSALGRYIESRVCVPICMSVWQLTFQLVDCVHSSACNT